MKESKDCNMKEESVFEALDQIYLETDNRKDIDYWSPLSKIIMESVELRDSKNLSQADLASLMETKQSVISRFENMGRLPNYDFIARLSQALDHSPGITLYGDYMAVVPLEKQVFLSEIAKSLNVSTQKLVQEMLENEIAIKTNNYLKEQTPFMNAGQDEYVNIYKTLLENNLSHAERNKSNLVTAATPEHGVSSNTDSNFALAV